MGEEASCPSQEEVVGEGEAEEAILWRVTEDYEVLLATRAGAGLQQLRQCCSAAIRWMRFRTVLVKIGHFKRFRCFAIRYVLQRAVGRT